MLKISIIIPTYNRAGYLSQAIESALSQDYPNLEVIVSDNASTDDTAKFIKQYVSDKRFKYFRNDENIGMVNNWRKALFEYSTGDYFLILSDDDYLVDESYIKKASELINLDETTVIVSAHTYIKDEDTGKMNKLECPFLHGVDGREVFMSRKRASTQGFALSSTIFNRSLAIKLNAFSNSFNLACDLELFLKMCLYGKVGVINEYASVYRRHKKNTSKDVKGDIRFLVNNNDAHLEPYKHAQSLGALTGDDLKYWENRISERFYRTLKIAYKNHFYDEAFIMLKNKDEYLLNKTLHDYHFRITAFKIKYSVQNKFKRLIS